MTKSLTACFVGLGSIGKRHLKNLVTICAERGIALSVDALRHAPAPLAVDIAPLIRTEYYNQEELPHYDLIFICNPSQSHYETLCALNDRADHFFIEKPVFTCPLSDEELRPFADEKKYYVACPLRHTKTFAALKDFVSSHPVYSVRSICSSYLPNWRPGVDYRKLYSASKESGGVALDLIHEFDYLFALFGFPDESKLIARHVSRLEIESSDVVSYVAAYPDKTLELHLDYFGRAPQRSCEIFTEDGVVLFDYLNAREERNDGYMRELRGFLDFVSGGIQNINSVPFSNEVLRQILNNRKKTF